MELSSERLLKVAGVLSAIGYAALVLSLILANKAERDGENV